MIDYYKILGVNRNATKDDIKDAYRKLSKKFHPDLNEGDKFFEERFKEVQEAYEKLSDQAFRQNYDTKYNANFAQANPDAGSSTNTTTNKEKGYEQVNPQGENVYSKPHINKLSSTYRTILKNPLIVLLFVILVLLTGASLNDHLRSSRTEDVSIEHVNIAAEEGNSVVNQQPLDIIEEVPTKYVYIKVQTKEPTGEIKTREASAIYPSNPGEKAIFFPDKWEPVFETFIYSSEIYKVNELNEAEKYKLMDEYCKSLRLRFFYGHTKSDGKIISRKCVVFDSYEKASEDRLLHESEF